MLQKWIEKIKEIWEWCGHIDQAFSIYGLIASILFGGGMSWLSSAIDWPWPLIIISGVAAFGIGLVISNQWLWRKKNAVKQKRVAKIAPTIECLKDHEILEGSVEGHGLQGGPWIVARVAIVNKELKAFHNVRVSIVSLIDHSEKFPSHLRGIVNIPFLLPFSEWQVEPSILNPLDSKFIDVFHHHQVFWNCHISLGSKDNSQIFCGTYAIEIQATSEEGSSERSEFIRTLPEI
ncbi:MAG: hypothetical protein KC592_19465 [Nitrospira sp.]|nr:hypothetical protein [Nitrospira sp.]